MRKSISSGFEGYSAAVLFNRKDLMDNALLAMHIKQVSQRMIAVQLWFS
jgi:hypothetical protein